jgi:glutamate--cysteine ligase catalytic subunit
MGMVTNVINHFNLDFIIPISKSDNNMDRAHKRGAVINEKFWFNMNCVQDSTYWNSDLHESDFTKSGPLQVAPKYEELYIHEVLAGKDEFPGLYSFIRKFMEIKGYSDKHKAQIEYILGFLLARAKGEIPTGAKFIRDYI